MNLYRSSRPEVFCKKGVKTNFAKFIGKQLCQSLFLIMLQAEVCNFIKKKTQAQVFYYKFCEIFKNTFLNRTPQVAASVYKFLYCTNRYEFYMKNQYFVLSFIYMKI